MSIDKDTGVRHHTHLPLQVTLIGQKRLLQLVSPFANFENLRASASSPGRIFCKYTIVKSRKRRKRRTLIVLFFIPLCPSCRCRRLRQPRHRPRSRHSPSPFHLSYSFGEAFLTSPVVPILRFLDEMSPSRFRFFDFSSFSVWSWSTSSTTFSDAAFYACSALRFNLSKGSSATL